MSSSPWPSSTPRSNASRRARATRVSTPARSAASSTRTESFGERDRLDRSLGHREEPEVRDHLQLAPVRDGAEPARLPADRLEDRLAAVERVVGAGGEDDELPLL